MSLHTGNRRFPGIATFEQPPVLVPTTVALLPAGAAEGSICPVTDDPENPVYVRRGGVWIPISGSGGGGSGLVTFENLTFMVDYNDPTAVDPPAGLVFTQQAEIDAFLAAAGTLNFKTFNKAWDSIPQFIAHTVFVILAAGIHHDPIRFFVANKVTIGLGSITIQGTFPSTWTPMDPTLQNLTIDSYDEGNLPACNPYVDCSSSHPGIFTGFDLRGAFAVLDSGQVNVIGWNDNNRLFLLDAVSPVPTKIDRIAWPSTKLDNVLWVTSPSLTDWYESKNTIQNITVRPPAGSAAAWVGNITTWWMFTHLFLDARASADTYGGFSGGFSESAFLRLAACSVIGQQSPSSYAPAWFHSSQPSGTLQMFGCYLGEFSEPSLFEGGLSFNLINTLFDNIVESGRVAALHVQNCALFEPFDFQYGRNTTIKNSKTAGILLGPFLSERTYGRAGTIPPICLRFEGCAGPCIMINSHTFQDLQYGVEQGWLDGGGNLDVGIEFIGVNADVKGLDSTIKVTGANGDVRFKDGSIWTYEALATAGPMIDYFKNSMWYMGSF